MFDSSSTWTQPVWTSFFGGVVHVLQFKPKHQGTNRASKSAHLFAPSRIFQTDYLTLKKNGDIFVSKQLTSTRTEDVINICM